MARVLFISGHVRPKGTVRLHKHFKVAYCNTCAGNRILVNPRKWDGWPEDMQIETGNCVGCGSTISVDSSKPQDVA